MNKSAKKSIGRVLLLLLIAAVAVGLALMPLLVAEVEEEGLQASILSGTVTTGEISTTVRGGGTLTQQEAVEISIPSGVMLTELLVSNGDHVSVGDEVALADRVTVMSAISQVQETLEYLSEQIEEAREASVSSTVTASAGGRVKLLYAQAGDSVQDVMAEHGALAVLSLDGLMAVEISRNTSLTPGDSVVVRLADDTEVVGWVESNLDGKLIITVEDEGYAIGEMVLVTTQDGDRVGAGELYIHNAWTATGISGTVSRVHVSLEATVTAGRTLFTLTDTEYTAEFQLLCDQRREYEAVLLELFQLYQNLAVTAANDGVISGVDDAGAYLLSDSGSGYFLSWLTNAPNGDDSQEYRNYLTQVTGVGANGWALKVNTNYLDVTDYKLLADMEIDTAAMTELVLYQGGAVIYELDAETDTWKQIDASSIAAGDILLFAQNVEGECVWIVRVSASDTVDGGMGTPDTGDSESSGNSQQGGTGMGTTGGGSWSGSNGSAAEETVTLYSLDRNVIMTVTGQEEMTISISVDEMDLLKLHLGQSARVTVDALRNASFTAYITEIGDTGESSGGSSKFTVTLTLTRAENMMNGMNAAVSIDLENAQSGLWIPVEALNEKGSTTYVYTGYDETTGEFRDPVTVETGLSDGERVLILSGLSEGDTFWYAYYDTLDVSTAQAETSGNSIFGK